MIRLLLFLFFPSLIAEARLEASRLSRSLACFSRLVPCGALLWFLHRSLHLTLQASLRTKYRRLPVARAEPGGFGPALRCGLAPWLRQDADRSLAGREELTAC